MIKIPNSEPVDIFTAIEQFTLFIWDDSIFINNIKLPLGDCVKDLLNIDNEQLEYMLQCCSELNKKEENFFKENINSIKNPLEFINEILKMCNSVLNIVLTLPPYKYFIESKYAYNSYFKLNSFSEVEETIALFECKTSKILDFPKKLISIVLTAISFRKYITIMVDGYFENLEKRNPEHYATGINNVFNDMYLFQMLNSELPARSEFNFNTAESIGITYLPLQNLESTDSRNKFILSEQITFKTYSAFLHLDFFRGLKFGHCPRRCHNCDTYFLLTSAHNTVYCNNIAPEEVQKKNPRTCRKIGAHKKEQNKKSTRTLAQIKYDTVYKRLGGRKRDRKISEDEWNEQVELAYSYKIKNEQGELSDFEYINIMDNF